MVWLIVLLVIAAALVICFISHIKVTVNYKRSGKDDRLSVHVKAIYGLVRLKYEISKLKMTAIDQAQLHTETTNQTSGHHKPQLLSEKDLSIGKKKAKSSWKRALKLLKFTDDLLGLAKRTLKHVKCTKLRWHTSIGWTEAHITAIVVGLIWAIKSPLIGFMMNLIDLKTTPDLQVHPTYNTNHFTTEALCIVKIRFGYAIFAGILLIFRIVKVKGGVRTWKNILFKA